MVSEGMGAAAAVFAVEEDDGNDSWKGLSESWKRYDRDVVTEAEVVEVVAGTVLFLDVEGAEALCILEGELKLRLAMV